MNKESVSSIGKRIRAVREEKGWSQEQFAERIGLSVTYTGMIERGERVPKLETFIRITNTLGTSADILLADVLDSRLDIKASAMKEKLDGLPDEDRELVFDIADVIVRYRANRK